MGRLQRLDQRVLGPEGPLKMSPRAGAWLTLCIGVLGLVAAGLDIAAVTTGGNVSLELLSLVFAGWIGLTFTRRGVRRLRQPE